MRMTIKSFLLLALFFSCSSLMAQTGSEKGSGGEELIVKTGDVFEFEGVTRQTIVMDSTTQSSETYNMDVLEVKEILDDQLVWEIRAVSISGDQPAVPMTMRMVTDHRGGLIEMGLGEETGMGANFMNFSFGSGKTKGLNGPGWLLTNELMAKKEGEEWGEETDETMTIGFLPGMEMELHITGITNYTFGGVIDTLGHQAVRIDWQVDEMYVYGSIEAPEGEEGGIEMHFEGNGGGSTYYSLEDRVQLAQLHEMNLDMVLNLDLPESTGLAGEKGFTGVTRQELVRVD